ncbi:hypothetical protein E4U21_007110 [Claviceps maximensis]|nr:hypothetical protein E4U21_007110 [Claviceps maximensis]
MEQAQLQLARVGGRPHAGPRQGVCYESVQHQISGFLEQLVFMWLLESWGLCRKTVPSQAVVIRHDGAEQADYAEEMMAFVLRGLGTL